MDAIRIGIAGLGRAGWGMHGPEVDAQAGKFKFVACCDTDPAHLKRFTDKYTSCVAYADIRDLVADPAVELVSVATRTTEHVEHALLALRAGKHVFLEKPIAVSYQQALKLKAAAAKARGRLFIRHNRRFEAGFAHVMEIMQSSMLGHVYEIKLRRNGYSRRDDWQTVIRAGGGQLLNWGPHIIDHALQFLGSPVAEQWSDLQKIAAVGDAEDHVHIILLGRKGRLVDLQISGGAALGEPEYLVLGTKGALQSVGNEFRLRYLDPASKLAKRRPKPDVIMDGFGTPDNLKWIDKTIPVSPKSGADMTKTIWECLHDSIRRGKPFPITLDQAIEVMRVVSAARTGTRFEIKGRGGRRG